MMAKLWIFIIVLLIYPFLLLAQANIQVDSNHVEAGNSFVLHFFLPSTFSQPDSIGFSSWQDVLPAQNIISETEWKRENQYWVKNVTTIYFNPDTLNLPPLPLLFHKKETIYTNPIKIIITSPSTPENVVDLSRIKDIHREPTLWIDYWQWALGTFAVILVLGMFFWVANRKPKQKVQSRVFETPAHELALKKLKLLAQKNLILNGLVKEHYAELTHILREYLEKRWRIPSLESTSDEILDMLKSTDFPPRLVLELKTLLEQADLAKFAKATPDEAFHIRSLVLARTIIEETKLHNNDLH